MVGYSDFYNTIDDIANHLKADFIGPASDEEILEFEEPLSRYSTGILYAQQWSLSAANVDTDTPAELFEEDTENDEETKNSDLYRQSSMGISFSCAPEEKIDISFSYAVYNHTEKKIIDKGKEINRHLYKREARSFSASVVVPAEISSLIISDKFTEDISVRLFVRKINADGSALLTVTALNKHRTNGMIAENNINALFQCELSVKNDSGFLPVYRKNIRKSFEEEKNEMLYDSENNYSYGHGCSSVHVENNCSVTEIKSCFIPEYRMLQMMPRIPENSDYLLMKYWGNADRIEACERLNSLVYEYERWLEGLKQNRDLISRYPEIADDSFKKIEVCIKRLKSGIDILKSNKPAWTAYVYMNESMLLQRIKTKHCSADNVSWYPFQAAFILQIIPDFVDNNSPFHDDVDLLWFPTGGGKTEAYLGLAAFAIFFRRLSGGRSEINGVTVIMRYTLRLLTLQQFERATALVCACEFMRKKYNIPGGEISIGLWIGSGMTPNHIEKAKETLDKLKADSTAQIYEANPMQVVKCPWCGAEIGVGGYSIINDKMNISCSNNPACEFHSHLPIYVVDDDIYKSAPTFILSTVDKFARITWEERAGNLLGANGCRPPELIIQDELHLISGPLGSVAGIYEAAVEEICRAYGKAPKIIASTATVKNAAEQIRVLYNRKMLQFPPNGLSHSDSFFAVEAGAEKRPARTYIGICSAASGPSETLIKIFALLTYLKFLYKLQRKPPEVIDQFYTYVGYFNSLKELGSGSTIISDRISAELKSLTAHVFKEEAAAAGLTTNMLPALLKSDELTSRNSAKEIKNVLERLTHKYTDDRCYDYILASNMLSVGIDIDRLGVMCVYGQPKSNSEYIQAASRVGRSNPGLVVTIYNNMRSRDKSYYEQFSYYHSTFYKYVEATSVTSYSPRAVEKALHCALMAIVRHTVSRFNANDSARNFTRDDPDVEAAKKLLLKRVAAVEPKIANYAEEWLDYYLDCWADLTDKMPHKLVFSDYHNSDFALFKSADSHVGSEIPTILNSARNVEPSSNIFFTRR